MGDFIGECVACGSFVEEEHDEGGGYFHTVEENYTTLGRFANKSERDSFCDSAWDPDLVHEVDPEHPFFYTIRAYPAYQGGTVMRLPCECSERGEEDGHKEWFNQDSAGSWNFPIHECCLELLDQYIAWSKRTKLPSFQLSSREHFYNVICKQQARNKLSRQSSPQGLEIEHPGVAWEHGYFGAQQGWRSLRIQNKQDFIRHYGPAIGGDPLKIQGLGSYLRLHLGLTYHGPLSSTQAVRSGAPKTRGIPSKRSGRPIQCYDHSSIREPTTDSCDDYVQSCLGLATNSEHHSIQLVPWVSPRDVVRPTAPLAFIPISVHCPPQQGPSANVSKVPTIMTLPTELFEQILQSLPPRSIVSLHRSCKAAAARIYLDNRFWRKSLLSNTLLGFTWDLDQIMSKDKTLCERNSAEALNWDWKELARVLARNGLYGVDEANSMATPAGLKARRRIWRCIEEIGKSSFSSTVS